MRRRHLLSGLLVLCSFYANPTAVIAAKDNMMPVTAETRKAAFRRVVAIWQDGRTDLVGDAVAPGYVGHSSSGDRDVEGLRRRVSEFHALYPDIRFRIEDQFAEGDRVVTRMTAVGTSKATGKSVRLIGLNISRFIGNRIAEEWPVWESVPTR